MELFGSTGGKRLPPLVAPANTKVPRYEKSTYEVEMTRDAAVGRQYNIEQRVEDFECLHPINFIDITLLSSKESSLIKHDLTLSVFDNVSHAYNDLLSPAARTIAHMLLIEGVTTHSIFSLINCFCQDVWRFFSQPDELFADGWDSFPDFQMDLSFDQASWYESLLACAPYWVNSSIP